MIEYPFERLNVLHGLGLLLPDSGFVINAKRIDEVYLGFFSNFSVVIETTARDLAGTARLSSRS